MIPELLIESAERHVREAYGEQNSLPIPVIFGCRGDRVAVIIPTPTDHLPDVEAVYAHAPKWRRHLEANDCDGAFVAFTSALPADRKAVIVTVLRRNETDHIFQIEVMAGGELSEQTSPAEADSPYAGLLNRPELN